MSDATTADHYCLSPSACRAGEMCIGAMEVASASLDVPTNPHWREVLWLHHGHDELYGDDGEMQCSRHPFADFRRDHIDSLIAHIGWSPIVRLRGGDTTP